MSANELKTLLHQQIEELTDEETVEVYEFVSAHYGHQADQFDSDSPEVLAKLEKSLAEATTNGYSGITTEQLQHQMKQWLAK